jgi:hypothetical protein
LWLLLLFFLLEPLLSSLQDIIDLFLIPFTSLFVPFAEFGEILDWIRRITHPVHFDLAVYPLLRGSGSVYFRFHDIDESDEDRQETRR